MAGAFLVTLREGLEVTLYSTYLAVALGYFFGVGRLTGRRIAGSPADALSAD